MNIILPPGKLGILLLSRLYLLNLLLMIVLCIYHDYYGINLSKPSQVLTARYLLITVSNTIKVSYNHTRIVKDLRCVLGSNRVDCA
jgi:hypothetical protein